MSNFVIGRYYIRKNQTRAHMCRFFRKYVIIYLHNCNKGIILMSNESSDIKDFFLGHSSYKKHPNFNNLKNKQNSAIILENDGIPAKAGKGNAYQYTKTGFREDIGLNVRSSWEANFIRVLNMYKIDYQFEPTVFSFPVKRGTKGYTPDFFFTRDQQWVEIKGYLDDKSKIKLKRFKRYYPDEFERLTCLIGKYSSQAKSFMEALEVPRIIFYEDMRNEYKEYILNWEGK